MFSRRLNKQNSNVDLQSSILLGINISYLLVTVLLGIYGAFYAAFSPNEFTITWAKYISIIFFAYFTTASVVFFLKNRQKASTAFKNKRRFFSFVVIALPGIFALLALIHFNAVAKGFPAIYTALTVEKRLTEAKIENKRRWGRRDRHEEVEISGFSDGFPVSRQYYNSVSVGETVLVKVMNSKLGTKIEFIDP